MDWSTSAAARGRAGAYNAAARYALYNVGDCGGCPSPDPATPPACVMAAPGCSANNGWTQEDVWCVSWGLAPALPFPEIYLRDNRQARQWQQISYYGQVVHGSRVYVSGVLTQKRACDETDPTKPLTERCSYRGTDNPPEQGWTQLWQRLNARDETRQSIRFLSDISWQNR